MDQQVAVYYRNCRLRWHLKLFVHFMHITLHNAHITFREMEKKENMTRLDFLELWVAGVVERVDRERVAAGGMERGDTKHTPFSWGKTGTPLERGCLGGRKEKERKHGRCVVCSSSVTTMCQTCQCWLHIDIHRSQNGPKTCWSQHHADM